MIHNADTATSVYVDTVDRRWKASHTTYKRVCHLSRDAAIQLAEMHRMTGARAAIRKMRTVAGAWNVYLYRKVGA